VTVSTSTVVFGMEVVVVVTLSQLAHQYSDALFKAKKVSLVKVTEVLVVVSVVVVGIVDTETMVVVEVVEIEVVTLVDVVVVVVVEVEVLVVVWIVLV
jgi:hypothetical protein